MMIQFPYKEKEQFKLDLIPMINVVFLLLIFFMLTSTTPTQQTTKIELPTAKTAEKSNKQLLIMTIDSNSSIQIDGKVVTVEALPTHLEKKISDKKNTVISIHADKAIEFELFGKVIGIAKQAGAEDFILATGIEKPVNEF